MLTIASPSFVNASVTQPLPLDMNLPSPSPFPPPCSLSFTFTGWGRTPQVWFPFPADSPPGRAVHPEERGCVPGGQGLAVVAAPRFPPAPAECHRWGRAAPCQGGGSTRQARRRAAASSHPRVNASTQAPRLHSADSDLEKLCSAPLAAPFWISLCPHQHRHRPPSAPCAAVRWAGGSWTETQLLPRGTCALTGHPSESWW